jgi:hypothetical protein
MMQLYGTRTRVKRKYVASTSSPQRANTVCPSALNLFEEHLMPNEPNQT